MKGVLVGVGAWVLGALLIGCASVIPAKIDEEASRRVNPSFVVELAPSRIHLGGDVTFQLRNTGNVSLATGTRFEVERLVGAEWKSVPWPEDSFFTMQSYPVPRGASSPAISFVTPELIDLPGVYRLILTARWEHPRDVDLDIEVMAHQEFTVEASA